MEGAFTCVRGMALALTICGPALAADTAADRPLWLRYPAVSPDGSEIAFTYAGQVWLVPAAGGEAVALTGGNFYSRSPVWSPDGTQIAFASKRHGNEDVFVTPAAGGEITRLTFHSADDRPMAFSADGSEVYFASARLGDPHANALDSVRGLGPFVAQPHAVPVGGGRSRMLWPTAALELAPAADGMRFLYADDPTPLENEWRKHQVSDAAQDIWLHDISTGTHERLTDWRGADRNPLWGADGTMLWLSERSGSFNIWRRPLEGGDAEQVTRHETWPVRFASAARDGTVVYAWNGELWRLPAGAAESERVDVRIRQGSLVGGSSIVNVNAQASEFAVSPDASEIAIVARGEVFVAAADGSATRRITDTPEMERFVDFAPDGRRLVYASERGGDWDIVEARLLGEEDTGFAGAAPFEEVTIVDSETDSLQPIYAPDGKRIAYFEDRSAIRVHDIAGGTSVEVLPAGLAYSYYDGDMAFAWSPDGAWLATQLGFGEEVALIDAAGEAPLRNISLNGFADEKPQVSADGAAVLWLSDRDGLRTSTFSGAQKDVYAAFLDWDAFDDFREGRASAGSPPANAIETAPSPFPDLDGLEHRSGRLTPFSSSIAFFRLTPDNKTLIFVADQPDGTTVAYALDTASSAIRALFTRPTAGGASYDTDPGVTALFVLSNGSITRYDIASGAPAPVPFTAEIDRDARAEVAAIFEHNWRMTAETFYVPDMQGADWPAIGAHYRRFVPHIIHWEDLAELLSEMVGELNASHQGSSYHASDPTADATASLGLYYDDAHRGAGMRIKAVLPGGPADRPGSALRPGAIILALDGSRITPDIDIHRLLNRRAGQQVLLEVLPADGGEAVTEIIEPIAPAYENEFAYRRWVATRRTLVQRLSDGRLGYIHLRLMNEAAYKTAFGELFGRFEDAEGVIVDIRANGGGNLHDQMVTMLTGRHDSSNVSREGVEIARNPLGRWTKPSILLVDSNSYSDGSVFPTLYQTKEIGPLVGARVPGTGTAVVRPPQIEPGLSYGIPELGFRLNDGTWFENHEVVPDILVYNDPQSVAEGRDVQLERAAEHLLALLPTP